ncbi:outer membrane usher protein [Rhizobiales bacterium GAS113]|nr:outer membrane usher protein [Rhizobiales bacterium GAS113]
MTAPSVQPLRLSRVPEPRVFFAWPIVVLLLLQRVPAAQAGEQLQLEVFINDVPTKLIGSFVAVDGQRLGARRQELEDIGVNPGKDTAATDIIALDEIAGLSYRYDVPQQRLLITIPDSLRATQVYRATTRPEAPTAVEAGYGAVLNYNLFAASSGDFNRSAFAFNGVSATFDARAFSPFGTLSQSAIVRSSPASPAGASGQGGVLRLDTTFAYSDPQTLISYRAGDAITGGLAWTRPVRLGGFQTQRNFGLRADLITLPLASVSGSAAVPSTVDVYINNLKTYSQDLNTGPYQITNIPVITGGGEARIVLRDAAGHETQTTSPFYVSQSLLAPGLFDFSFEAGLPRINYGTTLDAYVRKPVASGSWRQGVFDWLTLEGHAEAGGGLLNGGAGAVLRTGGFGVASFALAASHFGGSTGLQPYASYEARIGPVTFNASSQMTFGNYNDLASVTARFQASGLKRSPSIFEVLRYDIPLAGAPALSPLFIDAKPPKMLNRISIGAPLSFDSGSLSASYIDLRAASGDRSKILTASYSRPLPFGAYVSATAFTDLGAKRNTGFFVGLSVPIGGSATASTSVSTGKDGTSVIEDVTKPLGLEPGSVGWRVTGSQGKPAVQSAAASYRSPYGWAEATIGHANHGATATAQVDGAIATMGTGVFLTSRIDDSFAVVEAGVPNVGVLYENRPIGVTDSNGRLLVPGLRSYQKNKIAIDTRNLPIDADVATTQDVIAPADRAGVRVDFGVRTKVEAAILVLSTADGKPVPAGSHGEIEGKQEFVVGYDGRAYVKGLAPENSIVVTTERGTCRASFTYMARPNEQVVLPITCR